MKATHKQTDKPHFEGYTEQTNQVVECIHVVDTRTETDAESDSKQSNRPQAVYSARKKCNLDVLFQLSTKKIQTANSTQQNTNNTIKKTKPNEKESLFFFILRGCFGNK